MKLNDNFQLFAEERREQILIMLKENSKLWVSELCTYFDVSSATIRSDLRMLESENKLKRTHGGAIPIEKASFELNTHEKKVVYSEEKHRIAIMAASMVEDGDTIALDTGTTTFELAKLLADKRDLTVVTNDLMIAPLLENNSTANVVFVGGMLRKGFHCTTGPSSHEQISKYNVDKAFMAANGLSLEKGVTTPGIDLAEVKRTMIRIASQVIFLLDSSKFGLISFIKFADLREVDMIVTDNMVSKKIVERMQMKNDNLNIVIV
jgi:DeoR family fructose operon transcriptional repressor